MRPLRLSVLIPLLLTLSSLASGGLLLLQQTSVATRNIEREGVEHLHTTMTHLQNMLTTPLAADSLEDARLSLAVTTLHPGVRTLLLANDEDVVVLGSRYIWEGANASAIAPYDRSAALRVRQEAGSSVKAEHGLLRGYYPVTFRTATGKPGLERRGVLFVEYELAPQLSAARYNALRQAAFLAGMMTFVSVAIAVLLHFLISMRVQRLVDASKHFAAGDMNTRVEPRGNDELTELGRAFNHMAEHRQRAEAELVHHRKNLEVLVEERTRALRENELRYRTVANFTNDWEIWRSHDGAYLYVSPSCRRITGYAAEEFASDPDLLRRIVHPDDQEHFLQHLHLYGARQHHQRIEFRLFRRDGTMIWIEHICQPVFDDNGTYLGTRASNRDLTEHKQQAQELARARDAAEAANRAKSMFLANMSHELRTPMNAILGFAQLMRQDRSLSAEHRSRVETIGRSGQHLLTLINDVLEISKIEAGKIALEPRPMDLLELLATIEEMNRLRAEKKGLSLVLAVAPDVPRFVSGDDKKLRQVLVNLLSNAIKFTTTGGITLRASREPGQGDRILFEVADTGCGIAPEEQARVFDAFYQTADASRRGEGTGLGLTISREYVHLMGGVLTLETAVGKGSVFRFTVPLGAVAESEVESRIPARRVVGLAPGQPVYRILIAEDRAESRELLRQILDTVGFEVRTAENGEKALNLFHTWRPHFVWMDMRMPVMDGYEATRKIKASVEGHNTVVVALTASAFEEDRAAVLATGCDDFLRKPLNIEEVFEAMAGHLGVRYLYAEETGPDTGTRKLSLDPASMARAVDPQTLAALAQAALLLDVQGARKAIGRIGPKAPELAEALGRLVDDYRFDELAKLCEGPRPAAGGG